LKKQHGQPERNGFTVGTEETGSVEVTSYKGDIGRLPAGAFMGNPIEDALLVEACSMASRQSSGNCSHVKSSDSHRCAALRTGGVKLCVTRMGKSLFEEAGDIRGEDEGEGM
jgi:hypothetical protein